MEDQRYPWKKQKRNLSNPKREKHPGKDEDSFCCLQTKYVTCIANPSNHSNNRILSDLTMRLSSVDEDLEMTFTRRSEDPLRPTENGVKKPSSNSFPRLQEDILLTTNKLQVCMCVYNCIYIYTEIVQLYILYIHKKTYACMHACMYACMHVCMYVCTYLCIYASVYPCIYVSM